MRKCTICGENPQMETVVRCESCQNLFNQLRELDPSAQSGERRLAPTASQLRQVVQGMTPRAVRRVTVKKARHVAAPKRDKKPLHPKRAEAYRLLREADADESKDASGYVYLISDGTAYKIGQSAAHPQTRLKSLQTGNPRLLVLLGHHRVADRHAEESKLHTKHIKHNILGEWFHPAPAIRREFA